MTERDNEYDNQQRLGLEEKELAILEKEVINRMAQNAIDATPIGSVINFENAFSKEN